MTLDKKAAVFVAVACSLLVSSCASEGDTRAAQGAQAGAALGAGIGLLIGALRGKPGEGLLVGAAVGAGEGAYEGWRQDQDDARTAELTAAIRDASSSRDASLAPDARAREELTRFLGTWTIDGWAELEPGKRAAVSGRATGHVEMNFFVELAYIDLSVEGFEGSQIWGSSTLGFDEHSAYAISTRFNTLPEPIRMTGSFDRSSRRFDFADGAARVSMRFENPDRFIVETELEGHTVESYRFTRN